jgi:hypothetical protein
MGRKTPRDYSGVREHSSGNVEGWISDLSFNNAGGLEYVVVDFKPHDDWGGEAKLQRSDADDNRQDEETVQLREGFPPQDGGPNRVVFGNVKNTPGAEGQELIVQFLDDEVVRYSRDELDELADLLDTYGRLSDVEGAVAEYRGELDDVEDRINEDVPDGGQEDVGEPTHDEERSIDHTKSLGRIVLHKVLKRI